MLYSNLPNEDVNFWVNGILNAERSVLARAITIIESTSPSHQKLAGKILDAILPKTGNSIRIGITGSPGVGKSTFINAFGNLLIQKYKKKVAVLAIDPSSSNTKGSILGDKTRMLELAVSEDAFVRPSPSGGDLGGVAARTRESILLCEAAGYDVVLVETVGVGQSETVVHQMVDFFLLMLLPGAGDDLQGIKRGIVEMADLIVVNKADGDNVVKAKEASQFYKHALQLGHGIRDNWQTDVKMISSLDQTGLDEIWDNICSFKVVQKASKTWAQNRSQQNISWFNEHVNQGIRQFLDQSKMVEALKLKHLEAIKDGEMHPLLAATEVVEQLFKTDID